MPRSTKLQKQEARGSFLKMLRSEWHLQIESSVSHLRFGTFYIRSRSVVPRHTSPSRNPSTRCQKISIINPRLINFWGGEKNSCLLIFYNLASSKFCLNLIHLLGISGFSRGHNLHCTLLTRELPASSCNFICHLTLRLTKEGGTHYDVKVSCKLSWWALEDRVSAQLLSSKTLHGHLNSLNL